MSMYFFLRYGLVAIAFLGWIFYQLAVKKKSWRDIQSDVIAIVFFIIVSAGIFYWLFA